MDFIKVLEKHINLQDLESKKVVLVYDGHPSHKSEAFLEWIDGFNGRVLPHMLPPGSSVLNQVETVWSLLKLSFSNLTASKTEEANISKRAISRKLRQQMHQAVELALDPDKVLNIALGGSNFRYHCVFNDVTL